MKVVIYGTENCAFCKVEKQWLDSKNVQYEYRDAVENRDEFERLDVGTAVPVTVVDGEIIRGFNRPALSKAIGL